MRILIWICKIIIIIIIYEGLRRKIKIKVLFELTLEIKQYSQYFYEIEIFIALFRINDYKHLTFFFVSN